MRLALSLVAPLTAGPDTVDVVVDAPPGETFAGLREGLLTVAADRGWIEASARASAVDYLVGGSPVADGQPVGHPPLLHGATLVLGGAPGPRTPDAGAGSNRRRGSAVAADRLSPVIAPAVVTLVAVAGPCAGTRWSLAVGHHLVGRDARCAVRLTDAEVSRRHVVLRVRASGVEARDLASTNGSSHRGPLDSARPVGGPAGADAKAREDAKVGGRAAGEETGADAMPGLGGALGESWSALRPGDELVVGASVLRLEALQVPALATHEGTRTPPRRGRPDGDGRLLLDPPATAPPTRAATTLEVPDEPAAPAPPRTSWLAVVLPLVLAVVMAIVWSPMALLFGLAAPVMVLGTSWGERRAGRARHAGEVARHQRRLAALREGAGAAMAADAAVLRATGPDPGTLATAAAHGGPELWSRGRGATLLRLGTGRVPGAVQVRHAAGSALRTGAMGTDTGTRTHGTHGTHEAAGSGAPEPLLVDTVHAEAPVLVDPAETGGIGVTGPREVCLAVVRAMLVGAAVLHSPARLRTAVPGSVWPGASWLPHAMAATGAGGAAGAGAPPDGGSSQVVRDVVDLVRARRGAKDPDGLGAASVSGPEVLLVLDRGAGDDDALVAELLDRGPAAGVHVIAVADHRDDLPSGCGAVVEVTADGTGHVTRLVTQEPLRWPASTNPATDHEAGSPVRLDLVPESAADASARHLAPLRSRSADAPRGALPDRLTLLETLPLDATDPSAIADGWERRPRSAVAVLGAREGGGRGDAAGPRPTGSSRWEVDLERDGPHALVAGTTGSGKSELLVTMVTSLAVANTPQECAFVLVDYKGGAAFADLVDLPHVVGLVTDLDTHLTARALASLGAEVRRRERVLAAAGCRDHASLVARRARGEDLPVVPRLLVVVDEFRVLAEEVPDFLGGLVRLAAVGRSLGVHLVLATQRPAGVVSADIRANTSLRVALRVQDESDSRDVIDHRGAARISASTPGRALVSVAGGEPAPVQAARVAGVSSGRGSRAATAARTSVTALPRRPPPSVARGSTGWTGSEAIVTGTTQAEANDAAAAREGHDGHEGPEEPSDVVRVVAAVRAAAAGMPAPDSPWLPALPESVPLPTIPLPTVRASAGDDPTRAATVTDTGSHAATGSRTAADPGVAVGVVDLPAQQRRDALRLDVSGPLVVVGAPRSGRSTALAAIAAASAGRSDGAHVYVVARASPALSGVERLGCVGAVVDPDDTERLLRLLHRLEELVVQRQRTAAQSSPVPGRSGPGPLTLLLVDDAGRLLDPRDAPLAGPGADVGDLVHRLVTEGPAVGVVPVLAGDRQLLGGRWGPVVTHRWLLAASDPTDHVMAGVRSRDVPAHMPPGRVLVVGSGPETVVGQVGVLDGRVSGPGTAPDAGSGTAPDAGSSLAAHAASAGHRGAAPPRVPELPSRLDLHELWGRCDDGPGPAPSAPQTPPPEDRAERVPVGLGGPDVDVVHVDLGPGDAWLVAGSPGTGRSSALVTLGRSALRCGRTVVVVAPPRSPLRAWALGAAVAAPAPGDAEALRSSLTASPGAAGQDETTVVLVDDVERVAGGPVDDVLAGALDGALGSFAVVAAGSPEDLVAAYRGLLPAMRRSRRALLLHPVPPGAGDVGGVRLPPPRPGPPGRAVVLRGGRVSTVQLAGPEEGPGRVGRAASCP